MASTHSAAGSAAGYLYQGDYALLGLVKRLSSGGSVSLEVFDDVTFHEEEGGDAREQLQLKHSIGDPRVMTDKSVDLWKTIAIWCDQVPESPEIEERRFSLITVHQVPEDSVASLLRPEPDPDRDPQAALERFETIAKETTDGPRAKFCARFLELGTGERETLIASMSVLDEAPNALDVEALLAERLEMAVPKKHREGFLNALRGWWYRQVLRMYFGKASKIDTQEVEAKLDELRLGYVEPDVTPITIDAQAHPGPSAHYEQRVFVEQLRLIAVAEKRVNNAIRDYYRAAAQRSEWERSGALLAGELSAYEYQLDDEWQHYRAMLIDQFGGDLASLEDDAREEFGRTIYSQCETDVEIGPRPRFSSPAAWLCRGSFHILADELRLGWHPDFADKLAKLKGETIGSG